MQGPPPSTPFVAYRAYPTHVFDLANSKAAGQQSASGNATDLLSPADAASQLSTPMAPSAGGKPKRGRRGKRGGGGGASDGSDYGGGDDSDSDAAEERAARPSTANAAEFADLDENLDNAAYMYYYDHRNSALQLYDTFSVPMCDLKRQLTLQYCMKQQDALELMRGLGDAPDLYTRRNMLAKAIHAHITHFQSNQMVRQWCHSVRQMTTQHVHAQHDLKLKQDQVNKVAELQARRAYQVEHGVPMPMPSAEDEELTDHHHPHQQPGGLHGVSQQNPHGINPKTGEPYKRGPYGARTPASAKPHQAAAPVFRVPVPGSTPGLAALDKLPYYWRSKLHVAKKCNSAFPEVTGATPQRAMLQMQLDEVKREWMTSAMTQTILNMRVGEKAAEKLMPGATVQAARAQAHAQAQAHQQLAAIQAQQQGGQAMHAQAVSASAVPAMAVAQATMAAMMPSFGMMPPTPQVKLEPLTPAPSGPPAKTTGRKRRASAKVKRYRDSDDDDDEDMAYEEHAPQDEDEQDLSSVFLDQLYPLPNIRLKRLAPGHYAISKIIEAPDYDEDAQQHVGRKKRTL